MGGPHPGHRVRPGRRPGPRRPQADGGGTLLALCGSGLVYTVLGWLADRPLVLAIALIQSAAMLLNLAIFSRQRRLQPFFWVIIALGLLTILSPRRLTHSG